MLRRQTVLGLCALFAFAPPAGAQLVDAAMKHANAEFKSAYDAIVSGTSQFGSADFDQWEAAAKKAGITIDRRDLLQDVPRLKALFDVKNQLIPGSNAKLAARLAQLPGTVLREWKVATGVRALFAGMSLAAASELFPGEKFSDRAFREFFAKFQ